MSTNPHLNAYQADLEDTIKTAEGAVGEVRVAFKKFLDKAADENTPKDIPSATPVAVAPPVPVVPEPTPVVPAPSPDSVPVTVTQGAK